MGKIATRQQIASLSGFSVINDGSRCATKKWTTDNYPNIMIIGDYSDNQLLREEDILIRQVAISMTTIASQIYMHIKHSSTAAIIDWGDGQQENISNDPSIGNDHVYRDGKQTHEIAIIGSNITNLTVIRGQLTSIDVSHSSSLIELSFVGDGQLTSLNVSMCPKLESLGCGGNQLTSLDVSKNTELANLACQRNQLTSLNVSMCPKLESLECGGNQLTSLDVSKNLELISLDCSETPLVTNESALFSLANSLPTKTSEFGNLYIFNDNSATWIKSICDSKRWNII